MFNEDYHQAKTPEDHKEQVESLCEKLKESDLVEDAMINDFGRYSNFDIFVFPTSKDGATTKKLKALINRTIKALGLKCQISKSFPSQRKYKTYFGQRVNDGWTKSFWQFDIDYNSYDAASNSFSAGI